MILTTLTIGEDCNKVASIFLWLTSFYGEQFLLTVLSDEVVIVEDFCESYTYVVKFFLVHFISSKCICRNY